MTGFLHPAEINGGTVLRDGPRGGEEVRPRLAAELGKSVGRQDSQT